MIRLLPVTLLILLLTSCDILLTDFSKPSPRLQGHHLDVSTGAATAVILDSPDATKYCFVIAIGGINAQIGYGDWVEEWKVNAGPVTATTICKVGFWESKQLYSNFNFEAEPGHTYRVEMRNRECTRLVDVTSDEHLVACEPATD